MVFFGFLLFLILFAKLFSGRGTCATRESSSNGCDRHTHGSSS